MNASHRRGCGSPEKARVSFKELKNQNQQTHYPTGAYKNKHSHLNPQQSLMVKGIKKGYLPQQRSPLRLGRRRRRRGLALRRRRKGLLGRKVVTHLVRVVAHRLFKLLRLDLNGGVRDV